MHLVSAEYALSKCLNSAGAHPQEQLGVAAVLGPVEDDQPVRLVPRQERREEVPLAPRHDLDGVREDGCGLGLAHHRDVLQREHFLQGVGQQGVGKEGGKDAEKKNPARAGSA